MKFDRDNKALFLVGKMHFIQIDLDQEPGNFTYKIRRISDISLEKILELTPAAPWDKKAPKVFVACKKHNMKRIHVFDHYHHKTMEEEAMGDHLEKFNSLNIDKVSGLMKHEAMLKSSEFKQFKHVVYLDYSEELDRH